MTRFRLPLGLPTLIAVAVGSQTAPEPLGWGMPACLALAGLMLTSAARRGGSAGPALALVVVLGLGAGALRRSDPAPLLPVFDGDSHRFAGRILRWGVRDDGIAIELRVHAVDGVVVPVATSVGLWGERTWGESPKASWIRVTARYEPSRGVTNEGGWGPAGAGRLRLARRTQVEWGPGPPPARLRDGVMAHTSARLRGFGERFASAVLLGRGSALQPEERDIFRRCGASHLTAVSGLHVGLAAMLAALLAAPLGRDARLTVTLAAVIGYAALSSWSPSALRSALMIGGFLIGRRLGRERSGIEWLILAATLALWGNPDLFHSVGFRLSVGAVAGIFLTLDLLPRTPSRITKLLGPMAVSLGAQWGTLPVAVATFGALAPVALVPNLVAVPLTGLFLPALLFSAVPALNSVAIPAAQLLASGLIEVLRWCAKTLPYLSYLPEPPGFAIWSHLALCAIYFAVPRAVRGSRMKSGTGLAMVLVIGLCLAPWPPTPGPWIVFLDVDQGDATLFRLSDGTVWLCDVGDDRGPSDAVRRAVIPVLRSKRVRAIDGILVSHRHRDHIGALTSLIGTVPVRAGFDTAYPGRAAWVDSLVRVHGTPWRVVAAGDTLHAGPGTRMVALHPSLPNAESEALSENLNNVSLVVRVEDSTWSMLLAGDLEGEGEEVLLSGGAVVGASILKVGHHGSKTSTGDAFLSAVSPNVAVLSCGADNRYGHPSRETLARLDSSGVEVLRTDRDGSVEVVPLKDGRLRVRTRPPRRGTPARDVLYGTNGSAKVPAFQSQMGSW